jgi:hypothetical protein
MSRPYSYWNELEAQFGRGNFDYLSAQDLASHIDLAQTPDQLHWLAWTLAVQGEVVLWMHTMHRALCVLNRKLLATFVATHFTDEALQKARDYAVGPHYPTLHLQFLARLAYKSESERPSVLETLRSGKLGSVGKIDLLPQSSAQAKLPTQY